MGMISATERLCRWQRFRLDTIHKGRQSYPKGRDDVTILTYYWGAKSGRNDTSFYRIESAFRETWLQCGMMKSVVVTDDPTEELKLFVAEFPNVEIQVEHSLIPGNLDTMSFDCNGKFASRFNTEYLMVIQDDGFPLRPGLDEFLGKWDFIGPPYVRDKIPQRWVARLLNLWTSNGGFSIRTHRMCELAAELWEKKYRHFKGDVHWIGEDAYYTETLLKHSFRYNRMMRMADVRSAKLFAVDLVVPQVVSELPFGFHRAETFVDFMNRGWISDVGCK